ncbi:protocatechuate 3,4-dioxygenase subunit alpha [Roseinatronobacter bogoriensis]|uniref:Protocatechuate 3,4-dioxygenase subunit alpha n=1 Tax=Roseinatronobacter bogoriensis subsp. barguzinensis TaxID=441209 RepID=A0A2K8K8B4_9RHOB|nr:MULTISPECIES: protocatechuate 3,4-dioxygenase subunit alpha [Rhodobaca]ATX65692.1 protocatechuate 3,4-dioxygenase subunit alpha [Rhodobaca barguzinensis]MBB4208364.1 protocatechuate 3,4-dioxygenase alpha subunit [Rhodobaca bogoriensis DSM 18756]TDW39005.1 protocatechuate 3,4-dioxygenase alpha subunit [Rhodobaca barguzinensis]TDY68812.1 protocatechuate 3,4-dioxygenase alpha subunit [Rhodobaca bogoriensis DSM 18756]
MTQKLDMLPETASQTAGPYVHIGLMPSYTGNGQIFDQEIGQSPIEEGAAGEIIEITGSVYDGTGWAMRDALIESWQPDAQGRFAGQEGADPKVNGFCRFAADATSGEFTLRTVKPGPVALRDGRMQAPHISLWIVARGINIGLQTRIYFEDEENSADPLLARIEQRPRVETLIAKKTGAGQYRFDIRLQGEGETVFLDI